MQKIKFYIKGMHCNSCATLIEEKLKESEGVIGAKVNFESQKVVIIYDEGKITKNEIKKIIEGVGEYRIVEKNNNEVNNMKEKEIKKENPPKNNLFTPISIIVASLIVSGAIIISGSGGKDVPTAQNTQAQNPSSQPSYNLQKPKPAGGENAPSIQTFEITKNDHIRGDFNAPITLVEFSDFECPFSERHYLTLKKILADYKGKVRLVYKHFPLGFHPNAQKAAEASECAGEQGKFWEYHDKLFENFTSGYSLENFKKWAKDLGLKPDEFNNCLDSGKYAKKVQTDYQEGLQKGVKGTPTTFVNGQLVSGALPYESFRQVIEQILNQ